MFRIISTSTIIVLFMVQFLATADPLPQLPPRAGASIQEDTGQVSISERPDANTTATNLAIAATIFTGVPGPKSCRGGIMTTLAVPRPDGLGLRTGARCYTLPAVAGCGNFIANKDDGCEARLFSEPDCVGFVNLAVFMPEARPVGGAWRSLSVECGIPAPDPASLGAPPLQGMISNVKRPQKD